MYGHLFHAAEIHVCMTTYFTLLKCMFVWLLISRCWNVCLYSHLFHAAEMYVCMATYFTLLKCMFVWLLISNYGNMPSSSCCFLLSNCFTTSYPNLDSLIYLDYYLITVLFRTLHYHNNTLFRVIAKKYSVPLNRALKSGINPACSLQ